MRVRLTVRVLRLLTRTGTVPLPHKGCPSEESNVLGHFNDKKAAVVLISLNGDGRRLRKPVHGVHRVRHAIVPEAVALSKVADIVNLRVYSVDSSCHLLEEFWSGIGGACAPAVTRAATKRAIEEQDRTMWLQQRRSQLEVVTSVERDEQNEFTVRRLTTELLQAGLANLCAQLLELWFLSLHLTQQCDFLGLARAHGMHRKVLFATDESSGYGYRHVEVLGAHPFLRLAQLDGDSRKPVQHALHRGGSDSGRCCVKLLVHLKGVAKAWNIGALEDAAGAAKL